MKLSSMAYQKGLQIVDVPRDGNGLFTSVCFHLNCIGTQVISPRELRKQLAKFMHDNPFCGTDAIHYRDFLTERIETENLFNADTEQPNEEDRVISGVENLETQKEIRWLKYLDNLESGIQWGEHLAVQALAEMLQLTIHIVATENPNMDPIRPVHCESHNEIVLGLIQQYHYVVLTKQHMCEVTVDKSHNAVSVTTEDSEKGYSHEAVNVCGLPYETSLIRENPDFTGKQTSIAPAEFEKPLPLLSDPHFEELANPDKYPDGINALTVERPKRITPRQFFNQRLLDVDGIC